MEIRVYHNNRCKISRQGLEYVQAKAGTVTIIDYMKNPFSVDDMKQLLMKLNMKPHDLIRTNEAIYKEKFKNKNFNDDEWIKIMLEYPNLIQRPIIETTYKAVVARPAELMDDLLKSNKK